jgi:hypothetical protein
LLVWSFDVQCPVVENDGKHSVFRHGFKLPRGFIEDWSKGPHTKDLMLERDISTDRKFD